MAFILSCLLILAVFISILITIGNICARYQITIFSFRDRILLTVLIQAGLLWMAFQVGSVLHLINRSTLIGFWLAVLGISSLSAFYFNHRKGGFASFEWRRLKFHLTPFEWFAAAGIVIYAILLCTIGILYPSTYADSMTYHMPRIYHWAQNHSVYPYANSILRQTIMPPFAEYQTLNLFLLSGKDYLSPLVQIFSLLGCGLAVSSITARLGGGRSAQWMAALLGLSLPSAIVQATATQNDIVVAFYVCIFVNFGLLWKEDFKRIWLSIPLGVSLGLALFSKGTAYAFVLPICIWLGIRALITTRKAILAGLAIAVLVLVINAPMYLWNWRLIGYPMGNPGDYANREMNPTLFLSSLIRDFNGQTHFTLSEESICSDYDRAFQQLHALLGIADDDPRNTYYLAPGFICPTRENLFYEASVNNPIHYSLIFLTALICLLWTKGVSKPVKVYLGLICLAYYMFLALFRFQIGGTRLMNTLFILAAPAVILMLDRIHPRAAVGVGMGLFIFSFIWVGNTLNRPLDFAKIQAALQNRTYSSLSPTPGLYENVDALTDVILAEKCQVIGIEYGSEVWEYPFWLALTEKGWNGSMEYTWVRNPTRTFISSTYKPCAIITNDADTRLAANPGFELFRDHPFSVLIKK